MHAGAQACGVDALATLCRLLLRSANNPVQVSMGDMRQAQSQVRPSALREVALELPRVGWQDVGGLQAVKQRLQEAVQWPQLHPESLARLGAQVCACVGLPWLCVF